MSKEEVESFAESKQRCVSFVGSNRHDLIQSLIHPYQGGIERLLRNENKTEFEIDVVELELLTQYAIKHVNSGACATSMTVDICEGILPSFIVVKK